MSLDYSLGPSIVAVTLAAVSIVALWRYRKKSAQEQALLKDALESLRTECHAQFTSLETAHASAEASRASARNLLAEGRFNSSRRAEALRLLRAGEAPATVAKSLGVARNEMRLLASVYAALTSK